MKQEAKEPRLGVQNVDINGGLVISLKPVRGKSTHWELARDDRPCGQEMRSPLRMVNPVNYPYSRGS